jgi:hypothetical protein
VTTGPRTVRGPRAHRAGARGQTTTEWLMIAGVLTAIAIFLIGIMPQAIRYYSRGIVFSVRTVAP